MNYRYSEAIDRQNILYNDGGVILCGYDGSGYVNAYRLADFHSPIGRKLCSEWLCCGAWKRVIPGYREAEVYGREPRTVKTLADIAAIVRNRG